MKPVLYILLGITGCFVSCKGKSTLRTISPVRSLYVLHADSAAHFLQTGNLALFYHHLTDMTILAADSLRDKRLLDSTGYILLQQSAIAPEEAAPHIRSAAMFVAHRFQRNFGDFQQALRYYLLAHAHAPKSGWLDEKAWFIENEICNIFTRRGDFEKAGHYGRMCEISLLHYAANSAKPLDYIQRLTRLYTNLGTLRESEEKDSLAQVYYLRGFTLADSIGYTRGSFANALALANLRYQQDSLAASVTWIQIAEPLLPALVKDPYYRERKASLLFLKGQVATHPETRNSDPAQIHTGIMMIRQAIDTLMAQYNGTRRREVAKYYVKLAEVYLDIDSLDLSHSAIRKGLFHITDADLLSYQIPHQNQFYAENTFIEIFSLYGQWFHRMYVKNGDPFYLQKAIAAVDAGLYVNELLRNEVAADPSRLAAIRQNKKLIHQGLEYVYEAHRREGKTEYLAMARTLFNRSKSILLGEKVLRSHLLDHLSASSKEDLISWQYELKENFLHKLSGSYSPDSLSGVIIGLQEKINQLLGEYRNRLDRDTLHSDYIEYSIYGETLFAFSSLRHEMKFVRLGPKSEIMTLIDRMNHFVLSQGMQDDTEIQRELYDFLIQPVTSALPERVVILPDAEISLIPFDMLRDPSGKELIYTHTLSYAYSYESYSPVDTQQEHPYEILCLAPRYEADAETSASHSRGSLFPLPFASMECDSIMSLFRVKTNQLQQIADTLLLESLGRTKIFHYAGHALVKKDIAYLALNSTAKPSSRLLTDEIALMLRGPDLVVLSACETGLGKLEPGEGILSLGRSFMETGTQATVISLWNVNDRATAGIMIGFYTHLLSGLPIDQALRKAKLAYIEAEWEEELSPYFWAGFIPAGNMNAYTRMD